jgi:hypothetical protein
MEINQFLLETEKINELILKLKLDYMLANSKKTYNKEKIVLEQFNNLEYKTLFEEKVLSNLYYSIPFMQNPRYLTLFMINKYLNFIHKKEDEFYINSLSFHIKQKNKILENNMLFISNYKKPYLKTLIEDNDIDYFLKVLSFRKNVGFELLKIGRADFDYIDKLIKKELKS